MGKLRTFAVKVHFVVPDAVDDLHHPSGGNHYDRRVVIELRAIGWDVMVMPCSGSLRSVLRAIPSDEVVLIDGLIACSASDVLLPEAERLRVVVLVHMPVDECGALLTARAIITTSAWSRDRLIAEHHLPPQQIHVAEPGVDRAQPAPGTSGGGSLLCVGVVAEHKGQDILFDALADLTDLTWRCTCVGALDRHPEFVAALQRRPIADRVEFAGVRTGKELEHAYARADVLVLPSRIEAYGMVVTEALARGLPVIAANVGGVPDTLGVAPEGRRPGLLVQADSPSDLSAALRSWLGEPALREELRAAARARSSTLGRWEETGRKVADVLNAVATPIR